MSTNTTYDPKHAEPTKPLLGDKIYNVVKNGAMVVLPALSAFYYALATIWGWPEPEKVVGTLAALNVFLGVVAVVAKVLYDKSGAGFDGTVDLQHVDGQKTVVMDIQTHPEDMLSQKTVTLKVNQP